MASWTRAYLYELSKKAPLRAPNLTYPTASGTGRGTGTRLTKGATTAATPLSTRNLYLTLSAKDSFFKGKGYLVVDIDASPCPLLATRGKITEEGVEYVSQAAKNIKALKISSKPRLRTHSRMPKSIVA